MMANKPEVVTCRHISKTPIMDAFEGKMDAFFEQLERGEVEYTAEEIAFADRLLELYPNHLMGRRREGDNT